MPSHAERFKGKRKKKEKRKNYPIDAVAKRERKPRGEYPREKKSLTYLFLEKGSRPYVKRRGGREKSCAGRNGRYLEKEGKKKEEKGEKRNHYSGMTFSKKKDYTTSKGGEGGNIEICSGRNEILKEKGRGDSSTEGSKRLS